MPSPSIFFSASIAPLWLSIKLCLFDFWYFVEEEEEEYDRRNKA
jgi:hypothetical protein